MNPYFMDETSRKAYLADERRRQNQEIFSQMRRIDAIQNDLVRQYRENTNEIQALQKRKKEEKEEEEEELEGMERIKKRRKEDKGKGLGRKIKRRKKSYYF